MGDWAKKPIEISGKYKQTLKENQEDSIFYQHILSCFFGESGRNIVINAAQGDLKWRSKTEADGGRS